MGLYVDIYIDGWHTIQVYGYHISLVRAQHLKTQIQTHNDAVRAYALSNSNPFICISVKWIISMDTHTIDQLWTRAGDVCDTKHDEDSIERRQHREHTAQWTRNAVVDANTEHKIERKKRKMYEIEKPHFR